MVTTMQRALVVAAVSTGVYAITAQDVSAQTVSDSAFLNRPLSDAGVRTRPRPEYDPTGIRVGGFELRPSLELGGGYDSNVFQAEGDLDSDGFYIIAPRVSLASNWSRHALVGTVGSRTRNFFSEDSENTTEADAAVRSRLDIGVNNALSTYGRIDRQFESRGEPDSVAITAENILFHRYGGGSRFDGQINRISYAVGGEYEVVNFENTPVNDNVIDAVGCTALNNGALPLPLSSDVDPNEAAPRFVDCELNNNDRDHKVTRAVAEVGYELIPDSGYNVFIRGIHNWRDFSDGRDRNAVDRDSQGFELVGGAKLELSDLIVGEVYAGYLEQNYHSNDIDDVSGITGGANLEWYPTPLLTARVNASRSVADTTINVFDGGDVDIASGRLDTSVGVGVDYELRRNILVITDASYTNSDFEGTTREDDVYTGGISTQYLINRSARANVGYEYRSRDSDINSERFDDHAITLSLRLQR